LIIPRVVFVGETSSGKSMWVIITNSNSKSRLAYKFNPMTIKKEN
jgi:hypothetical protein